MRFKSVFASIAVLFAAFFFGATLSAQAAGSPELAVTDGAPATVLHQNQVPVTVTAANPDGPYGYNLAIRYVLPVGVSYVAGSESSRAGDPKVIPNQPGAGQTTLIWSNVDDLSPSSSRTLSFQLEYDRSVLDVGDEIRTRAEAYISTEPRDETDFNPDGTAGNPGPGSWTGSGSDEAESDITAIKVEKSEPHPEGEIPRGLHDHQTIYTLTVTNNTVNPTAGVRLEDWVPAGLEFLGCEATPDHTTDAPTNPGNTEEYPGSGPIDVRPVPDCVQPDTVETVETDPDDDGPLPHGVYTHVVWENIGDFAPSQTKQLRYAAAIPIRENTIEWTGGTAPGTGGPQAANLDNNSGPETRDEQELLNGATVAGDYMASGQPPLPVSDSTTLLRTAEDLAIQKSNDNHSLNQGDLTKWTIDVQVSEYRYLNDVTIRDVVPDGLCPLGSANLAHNPSGSDSQCDPVPGKTPSRPYTTVEEQPDGSYDITWNKATWPQLAHLVPNQTLQLEFWTRTRTNFQENFADAGPVLTRDSVTNNIDTEGASFVRCEGGNPDCTSPAPGTRIDSDWTDGDRVTDVSGSKKHAADPVLEKTVAANYPASGSCSDLGAAEYGKTVPLYGPGDQVCWRLRIVFPANLDTQSLDVHDLLPKNIAYVPGSWQATPGQNTVEIADFTSPDPSRLTWSIGEDDDVDAGGLVFDVTFKSEVGSPEGHHSGDVEGNLLKFSFVNTAGTSFALRDRADFRMKMPELDLVKGVRDVAGVPSAGYGPNVDHRQVMGGDLVTYRVDVSNAGNTRADSARVWDLLPAGISCSDLQPGSISDGGSCTNVAPGQDRIEWSGITIAEDAAKTLTYQVKVPAGVSPDQTFVNTAGVVEYLYESNDGTDYKLVPDNPVVKDDALTPNTFPAEDVSDIYTADAVVTKTRTTSVDEAGNNKSTQATIGERIDYTVTTTIPKGTTLYGSPTVVDQLGSRQTLVPGSLCDPACTLDGSPLPSGGVSVAESPANTVVASFPATWANTTGRDVKLVLRFSVTVLDVDANVRGSKLPNSAKLTFKDQLDRTVTHSGSVNTTIVEPKIVASKSNDLGGDRVQAGQIVGYTVKASARSGTNYSSAHDVTVVDTLPAGIDPVDGSGDAVADGGTVGPQGGIWNAGARTITWTPATTSALAVIAPGGEVALRYDARVESPIVSGAIYTNTVAEQTSSLAGNTPGERSPGSSAPTVGDYSSTADNTIRAELPKITKQVSPDPVTNGNRVTWQLKVTVPAHLISYDTSVIDVVPDGFEVDGYGAINCASGCLGGDPAITTFPTAVAGDSTTVASWYLGDLAASPQDRVYNLNLNGHLRDTYRTGGGHVASGDVLTNEASVYTNRSDKVPGTPSTLPANFDDVAGPARATSHVVEPKLTIDKSVDAGPRVSAGQSLTYTVKVKNTGTSPAYDLVIKDRPDVELTNVTAVQGAAWVTKAWSVGDRNMEWTVPGPVAVGETVTLTYTAKVTSDLNAADTIDNTAAIEEYFGVPESTRSSQPNPDYHRYTGPDDAVRLLAVQPDLGIVKTPDDGDAVAGTDSSFTIKVSNPGGSTAHNVIVEDLLPAGLTYTAGTATASPTTGFSETAPLKWKIEKLLAGRTVTITLPVHVSPDVADGTRLVNRATTTATEVPDPRSDDGSLKVRTRADVSIVKTADRRHYQGGDEITYTLVVKNNGPSTARNVKAHDELPSEMDFLSVNPAAPTCVEAGGTVDCSFGSLQPGAEKTITIKTKAKGTPPITGPDHHEHQLTVSKEEAYLSIPAGQTVTRTLTCAGQGLVSDGSYRILSVDQGQSLSDVHVVESSSTAAGSYRFTVRNDSEGQAQVKVFTVCLPARTETSEHHDHGLIEGAPITTTATGLAPGRHSFHLAAPVGYRAVAPGMTVAHGDARIVTSEEDGNGGWNFTVEVTSPSADLSLSVRPLKEITGVALGHAHDLVFEHPKITIKVKPGERLTGRVSCPVGYKGITATWDVPPGLLLLGNEPEPINRDFDLVNTTDHEIEATLDLLCLRILTGTEIDALDPVVNTATVSTTTTDPNPANNSSSVGVTISRQLGSARPAPSVLRLKTQPLRTTRSGAVVRFAARCVGATACSGRAVVTARLPRKQKRGTRLVVLGKRNFRIAPNRTTTVRVKVKHRFRKLIRKRTIRKVRIQAGGVSRNARIVR